MAPSARQALELPAGTFAATGSDLGDVLETTSQPLGTHDHRVRRPGSGRARRSRPPPRAGAAPRRVEDTGLSNEFLIDLILKILYIQGARTGRQLVDTICLPFPFVDEQLLAAAAPAARRGAGDQRAQPGRVHLRSDRRGPRPRQGRARRPASTSGRRRCRSSSTRTGWTGSRSATRTSPARWCGKAFNWLVLAAGMLEMLGPAINSAKSLFLYGESGNGKTAIAETIARLLGGSLYIPHAIEIDGQIMVLYDPVYHQAGGGRAAGAGHGDRVAASTPGRRSTTSATSWCTGRWCSPAAS